MIPADWFEALRAEPDDDALRLVLADKLEENGESRRAELIRLQLLPGAPRRGYSWHDVRMLLETMDRLPADRLILFQHIHAHAGGWLPGLSLWLARHVRWERGLAGAVKWPLESWLKHGPDLDALEPRYRPVVSDRLPENVHGSYRWGLVDDGKTWTRFGSLLPASIFYRLPGDSWARCWSMHRDVAGGRREWWADNDAGRTNAALAHAVRRYCEEGGAECSEKNAPRAGWFVA